MAQPRRYELQAAFKNILGSSNVYFQPPETLKMSYPCIVYELSKYHDRNADNKLYGHHSQYQVTLIDRNPDSPYKDSLHEFPLTSLSSTFTADGLNHFVFTTYY